MGEKRRYGNASLLDSVTIMFTPRGRFGVLVCFRLPSINFTDENSQKIHKRKDKCLLYSLCNINFSLWISHMPILLLSRGDKEGRDLLRKALEARYGMSVPAIETLKIDFEGRVRTKVGPISTWVPLATTTYFAFPGRGRWDFSVRAVGVPLRDGSNALDGDIYRKRRRNGEIQIIANPEHVRAARLWRFVAMGMILIPLSQQFIELQGTGERSFRAINLETKDTIEVVLNDDYTVSKVFARSANPAMNFQEQTYILRAEDGQVAVNDFMLPAKLTRLWDDEEQYEVKPVAVEINLPLSDGIFELES